MKISDVIQELARIISEQGDKEIPENFWISAPYGEIEIQ